ncbi:MAG: Asp23/Gls24 family envelope stress response protein [Erysipelotrichaceae bacterium]|nr:Asp23/Gls24 family envelope stress response protein [Erysipelotrichaceae bacterium]
MPVNKSGTYGEIKISDNAIASLIGSAVAECYGVVGVTPKKAMDKVNELLKIENYGKGIVVSSKNSVLTIDLYVVLSFGVKIPEVVREIQKRVKYTVENALNMDVIAVNVHVEGIKVN